MRLAAVAVLVVAVAGVAWVLAMVLAPTAGNEVGQTRADDGANGVTFQATLVATSPRWRFLVDLDSHSEDVGAFGLSGIVLEEPGGSRFAATEVDVVDRQSHHVKAILEFPAPGSVTGTLVALDLAGVPERRLIFNP